MRADVRMNPENQQRVLEPTGSFSDQLDMVTPMTTVLENILEHRCAELTELGAKAFGQTGLSETPEVGRPAC
jgi:hypothetical protein